MKSLRIIIILVAVVIPGFAFSQTGSLLQLNKEIDRQHKKGNKVIVLEPGTYTAQGTVLIDSSFRGVEITAKGLVTIESSSKEPVFEIRNASNFSLTGIVFKSVDKEDSASPIGFYFKPSAGAKILWMEGSTAIRIIDSSDIKIRDNTISGYWNGIYITTERGKTKSIIVSGNQIKDCGYWSIGAHKGLKEGSADHPMYDIQFINNRIARCEQGPVFRGVANGLMSGNEVVGNIIAIRLEQSDNNLIKGNIIHKNLQSGIWLYNGSSSNRILNNEIYDNNLQVERIVTIAKKYGLDQKYIPGNLVCYDRISKRDYSKYTRMAKDNQNDLVFNNEFWPYPTVKDYITPSSRLGVLNSDLYKKYWGMYFCQWGGVGIELRNQANRNIIEGNNIYNSAPLQMKTGYMLYGIRISQLNLHEPGNYASRGNRISGNRITNMVKGQILDDNPRDNIKADNLISD